MTIRAWDYRAEYEIERADILAAVDLIFGSGQLILGESVRRFEEEFAAYHSVPHCVGLDNGTNAIKLGLQALGIGRGDEVITVANSAPATAVAIHAAGATPVFVDVHPGTYLMNAGQASAAVTSRTRCLLPVHLYGQCADMAAVASVAARYDLLILEDCAQAHGSRQDNRPAGTAGHVGAFSFYPTKVLGAYGDGGAVVTALDSVAGRLRTLRYYGMADRQHVIDIPAHNSRLDEVQAEILRRKLRRLGEYIAARRAVADRYDRGLAGTGLGLPVTAAGNEHVYYLYVVCHPRRDEIVSALLREDIVAGVHYPSPAHTMPAFARFGLGPGSLPVTERLSSEVFSLPMYPTLSRTDQDRVIDTLVRLARRYGADG